MASVPGAERVREPGNESGGAEDLGRGNHGGAGKSGFRFDDERICEREGLGCLANEAVGLKK